MFAEGHLVDLTLLPVERGGALVVGGGEALDRGAHLRWRGVAGTSQGRPFENAEPDLDLVEPGGVGWGEVEVDVAMTGEAAEALIAEGLARLTDETVPHGSALRRSLEEVRQRGYAVNDRQWHSETAGVAAPILDARGEAVAALGISGPSSRLNRREMLDRLGRIARNAAAEIAMRLPEPAAHEHG